ncbi:MAG: AraC family transcriptional regulator [Lachnospiraceae bacterium]|nr:AraC family transcriptional regulator [Lachnospiraceae bacterium]
MIPKSTSLPGEQNMLERKRHGTALLPIAIYQRDFHSNPVPLHWHPELELAFVTKGRICYTVGRRKFFLEEGDGFFINSDMLHAVPRDEDCAGSMCSVVFHQRLIGGNMESIYWVKYVTPLLGSSLKYLHLKAGNAAQAPIIEEIRRLWGICSEKPYGYEFEVRSILSRIVLYLCDLQDTAPTPLSSGLVREESRIKKLLDYIDRHIGEEITLADLSARVSISESECLRSFKAATGTTPIQYIKQLRIEKAVELLESTNEKIVDIAVACGFQDMSYFAKTFRQINGCTPRKYRALSGKQKTSS